MSHVALIMAGGTGGHVIPGLSIAEELVRRGFSIVWLGTTTGIENQLVAKAGYPIARIRFSAVRGKGLFTWLLLPFTLLRGFWQALQVMRRVKPALVVGMGGYVTFPGGMMAALLGKRVVVHESNAVAGLANRVLAMVADVILVGFPDAFEKPIKSVLPKFLPKPKKVIWSGNPVRADIAAIAAPLQRYATRNGPLRLLVVGGSLGAQGLNKLVVEALATLPVAARPVVVHQSGAKLFDELRADYGRLGVEAEVLPFIDNMADRYAWCDVLLCRAGALTVSEVAAAGVAAIFVPLPYAVEDEQSHNARFLADRGAARIIQQKETSPQQLAALLSRLQRAELEAMARAARSMGKPDATLHCVAMCIDGKADDHAT